MSLGAFCRNLGHSVSENSPTILTVMSVVGVIFTAISATRDTIYAQELLYDELEKTGEDIDDLTKGDVIDICWKCYIPTAISATLTTACVIGSRYCSGRQNQVLASSYLLSQATLNEYQRKVVERIGKNKEEQIRAEIVKERAEVSSPKANFVRDSQEAYITGHGNTLFYDTVTGDYFRSDIGFIKEVRNKINERLISGMEMSYDLNDILGFWDRPHTSLGDCKGVDASHLLEVRITPEIMDNNEVRVLLSYEVYPMSILLSGSDGRIQR